MEPASRWISEALEMRRALDLIDALEAGDKRALRKWIHWEPDGAAVFFFDKNTLEPPGFLIADAHTVRQGAFRAMRKGDLESPARLFVGDLIRGKLYGAVSIAPKPLTRAGWSVAYIPQNLLAALWLMVMERATGTRRIARCEICGERMDVTGSRSHKRVHARCSLRERMARYRAKNKP
jgi:hypothetical protein